MSTLSFKRLVIAILLVLGCFWALGSAADQEPDTRQRFLATPAWLHEHIDDPGVVVVDVREDKYFDGRVIPGAIRMPWRLMRKNDVLYGLGGVFVGLEEAQAILGKHGITRSDTVVLYDSVERDGGATSSYVFWVLDVLGHQEIKVLERGIDGWQDAGHAVEAEPARLEPALYQAPVDEVRIRRRIDSDQIYQRLGDPYYQIIDVRSEAEYLGQKPNTALDGTVLKLGHIPTAYNVDYTRNWVSDESKAVKPHDELTALYAGLDPNKGTVVYCHSGRRGSFGYFILRTLGFSDVMLYDNSWFDWGAHHNYYPVETKANVPASNGALPSPSAAQAKVPARASTPSPASGGSGGDGYVSCGG